MKIADDHLVTLTWRVTDPDGALLDERDRKRPITYVHGRSKLLPAVQRALAGRAAGDTFRVHLAPEDAYGERQDLPAIEIPRERLPADVPAEIGARMTADGPDGERIPLWITGFHDDKVTLDPNNPLAGKSLHFKITVVSVRAATPEEATRAGQEV